MPTNQDCSIGDGDPHDTRLAKAFLAAEARLAAHRLICITEEEMYEAFDEMLALPKHHPSLQIPLPDPEMLPPELETLPDAVDTPTTLENNPRIRPALDYIDSPQLRARLLQAVLYLADTAAVEPEVADAAILDLDSPSESALICASLLHSLSVTVGQDEDRR